MMGSVAGKVTDLDANPISGATVTAFFADSGNFAADTTTDSNGDYTLDSLSAETYDLRATKEGYERAANDGVVVKDSQTTTANPVVSSLTYKARGEFDRDGGVAVFGRNNYTLGGAVGVRGEVADPNGYGLSTPDDAEIGGLLATTDDHTVTVDGTRTLRLGSPGTDGLGSEAGGNVVGGSEFNEVNDAVGVTVGGGGASSGPHEVYDNYATIGGGKGNQAGDSPSGSENAIGATVAGGDGNTASAEHATVGGGDTNTASALRATVGGGERNEATDRWATVGGGDGNAADGEAATVAGGNGNAAESSWTTVGGGDSNYAFGGYDTIAGGRDNRAAASGFVGSQFATVGGGDGNEVYGNYDAIGGGQNNRTGSSGTDTDLYATVPGGSGNVVTGKYGFAAGRLAETVHDGTFVWADSDNASFSSTGQNQFLVDADGGVGIGTNSPVSQLHVRGSEDGAASPGNHVAFVENTQSNSADVLSLKINETGNLETGNNFITFRSADGNIGAIEGNGSGGITLNTSSGDYAEYLPRLDPDEAIEPGEVVGLVEGAVTRRTVDADRALVVSEQSIVTGNAPGTDRQDRRDHEVCAFVGQVPVKVRGPADGGDLVVASGEGDGTAVAVDPAEWTPDEADPLVGETLEGTDDPSVTEVAVLVGLGAGDAVGETVLQRLTTELRARDERIDVQRDRIDDLAAETESLRAENETLRERLTALEARVGAGPAHADD